MILASAVSPDIDINSLITSSAINYSRCNWVICTQAALPFGHSLLACKLLLWHSPFSHRATWPFPAQNHSWWLPHFRAPAAAFCRCQLLHRSWRAFRCACSFAPGTLMACCCPVHWSLVRSLITWFCRSAVGASTLHTRHQLWRCQKCQLVRRPLFALL